MAISFNGIPNTLRVPFAYIEFDNSGALGGSAPMPFKGLILGQRLASAPVAAGVPTRIGSADEAASLFGIGGMIHRQALAWFKNNQFTELWAIALDEAGAGVAASGTVAFSGTSTAAGVVYLYIGGERIAVSIPSGTAASAVATAVGAAINARTDIPVVATVNTATVTITCRWKGETGNDIDVRLNYLTGETLPAGITATAPVTGKLTSGATNPALTPAITAMGDEQYHVIANPFKDATSLTALKAELDRRWGPTVQKEGVALMASDDTVGNLATWGNAQNSQLFSTLGTKKSPTPGFETSAAFAAVVAYHGAIDPARPFQTLPLNGVLAPAFADRFTLSEANSLLFDGISTTMVGTDGTVMLQRVITMYQRNGLGAEDPSYLDLTTVLTLAYLRYDVRNTIQTKYPRHKLADDGTNFGPGQPIVTPKVIKAEIVAAARRWEEAGLVENVESFKASLVVERNTVDRNRLDMLMQPDAINGFLVAGVQIKFIL